MILAKMLALLGIYTPVVSDDPELTKAKNLSRIAHQQHARIAAKATASALNLLHERSVDERPAALMRSTESMVETVEQNSTSTIDAIVREMQGRQ